MAVNSCRLLRLPSMTWMRHLSSASGCPDDKGRVLTIKEGKTQCKNLKSSEKFNID